jgi:very-short-patch-repair endonuclease
MHSIALLLLLGIVVVICLAFAAARGAKKRGAGQIATRIRPLLTKAEQAMYWRLLETFPDGVVLAQVAFSALITSAKEHRNRYDRKIADFVLCDKSLAVQAIIELDDASHKGREAADAARSALLESAGYKVLRFPRVPDIDALRAAVVPKATSGK